jgi:glycosyltransferase involved in cell wall biosynthesis
MPDRENTPCRGPQSGLRLSVIIPTRNRAAIIVENLHRLAKQLLAANQFEVLVCDDASEDDTFNRLQALRLPFDLRLFRLDECGGPGKARNLLIREARADKLVILNDDAMLTPGGLAMHAEVLDMTHGQHIAVLGKFSFPDDFQRTPMGCVLEHTNLSFRYPLMEPNSLYGALGFYSCNLGIHKNAVIEAGLFNEGYPGTGAEDMELGDRLAKRGHAVVYIDKCLAIHEHRLTIHDFCRAQIGRGGGGVLRPFNLPELIFHYDDIDTNSLAQLRQELDPAEEAVERLKDAIHVLHLRTTVDSSIGDGRSIPWREEPLRYASHAQWRMRAAEITAEADRALRDIMGLMRLKTLKAPALGVLFQACSFLKWRYDTIGIARSPWIDAFAAETSRRKAVRVERHPPMETIQNTSGLNSKCVEPTPDGVLRGLPTQANSETPCPGRDFFAEMYGNREKLRIFCRHRSRELAGSTQTDRPLFSVVTPSYNQARYLEDTIMGVLLQGENDFEHIVMDGGSTDGSVQLLEAYPHLRWKSEKDRGQTHALNKALELAQGELIAWINSDDFHTPGAFTNVKKAFADQPQEMMFIGGNLWLYEESGRTGHFPGKALQFDDLLRYWSRGIPPAQPSLFFRRELIVEIGFPQEDLTYAMDYEYWLRATLRHPIRHIPQLLATNRLHSSSKSGSGDDWSPFFGEYHACYERYRGHSERWGKGVILSVAVPFGMKRIKNPGKELARLMQVLSDLGLFKLRAMEILVITDFPELVEQLNVSGIPVPVCVVPAGDSMDAVTFISRSLESANGHCIHFASLDTRYPQRWHGPMVDYLLDNPQILAHIDRELPNNPHAWIPSDGSIASHAIYNTELLRRQWKAQSSPAIRP